MQLGIINVYVHPPGHVVKNNSFIDVYAEKTKPKTETIIRVLAVLWCGTPNSIIADIAINARYIINPYIHAGWPINDVHPSLSAHVFAKKL